MKIRNIVALVLSSVCTYGSFDAGRNGYIGVAFLFAILSVNLYTAYLFGIRDKK